MNSGARPISPISMVLSSTMRPASNRIALTEELCRLAGELKEIVFIIIQTYELRRGAGNESRQPFVNRIKLSGPKSSKYATSIVSYALVQTLTSSISDHIDPVGSSPLEIVGEAHWDRLRFDHKGLNLV